MGQTNEQSKGKMTTRQFGEFAKWMALYAIGQKCVKPVVLLEDLEENAEKPAESGCCVIYARGRNIPLTESKNITFKEEGIAKLKEANKNYNNLTPILAYVCVDEMEGARKIRIFWATLADAEEMKDDLEVGFLKSSEGGITLRYTKGVRVNRLKEIKDSDKMNYIELQFND